MCIFCVRSICVCIIRYPYLQTLKLKDFTKWVILHVGHLNAVRFLKIKFLLAIWNTLMSFCLKI